MPSFLYAVVPLVVIAVAVALMVRARGRKRTKRPVREASAFVLLEGNLWDACVVDDVKEPWSRLATEPIRGFCGVAPGRHRIKTATPSGDAILDFVVYPGEVLSWRLDAERARFAPHDLEADVRAQLDAAPVSTTDLAQAVAGARAKMPGWLVHLRTTVGMAKDRETLAPVETAGSVDRVRKRFAKLVATAEGDAADHHPDHLAVARGLGEALVGKPLSRREMRALVAPSREIAARLVDAGDAERAMRVVGLGLALLPSDPELMVVAGCALAAKGDLDEAMRALEAALERDRCLEAEDVARAMRARLELKSRLGRSVRVESRSM